MILRVFLMAYRLAWFALLPLVLIYLWRRARRDPDYLRHLPERFGFYGPVPAKGAIWVHAVSLGEIRSATALIKEILARGDKVVLTHFTPAGRRESARLFAQEIATNQLTAVWVPFDMAWCYRRFFKAFRPRIGLTLEVEIWPSMIFTARDAGVPLYLCNGQYATKSLARDNRGLRLRLRVVQGLAGAFVKSRLQAQRFTEIGLANVMATGELRFDQPIPPEHLHAARNLRPELGPTRPVITIASGVEGEEQLFTDLILKMRAKSASTGCAMPLFVYVPRAPERFNILAESFEQKGIKCLRRSNALDKGLSLNAPIDVVDVLLGDSLGEMFFYLALADQVIVGGGFTPRGAHNIIEPLMLGKPVLVGPYVWTIEYPFVEAEQAGVVRSLPDGEALFAALNAPSPVGMDAKIHSFLAEHAGASARTLAAIDKVMNRP